MSTPTIGGFPESHLLHILERACGAAGLDGEIASVLRGHTNAVVQLATVPVVVKIARHGTDCGDVDNTVQVVRWLMEQGFPTVPLHSVPQPVVVDGHAVTFWTYLPQSERPVLAADIAKPLYILHNLPTPPVPLRRRDDVTAIRKSLAATTLLPADNIHFLTRRLDRIVEALPTVRYALPESVIHGDPQHRNTLYDGDQALLCDWDTVAIGQPEWDLVTIEIHCRRFGHGVASYQAFAQSYGFDVCGWSDYAIMRDLRELRMITTNAAKTTHAPRTLPEVLRRIEGLRTADSQMRWHIL